VRSDSLASLTATGQQAMTEYGVTTVIDLRAESEIARDPKPASPLVQRITLVDDDLFPELNERPGMQERYMLILDRSQPAFGAVFNAIADAEGGVLFHCFAGKDRTGLVAAMMLTLAGVDPDAIGADYAETDVQLAKKYEEWLAGAAPERLASMRDELRCPPQWTLDALGHLDGKWGGVAGYLEAAGVSAQALTRLESRLD
jgi:protein-tyrosine phosphatase